MITLIIYDCVSIAGLYVVLGRHLVERYANFRQHHADAYLLMEPERRMIGRDGLIDWLCWSRFASPRGRIGVAQWASDTPQPCRTAAQKSVLIGHQCVLMPTIAPATAAAVSLAVIMAGIAISNVLIIALARKPAPIYAALRARNIAVAAQLQQYVLLFARPWIG
jgi:hypothetical protein